MVETAAAVPVESTIGVAGAGTMGRGIAEVAARAGHDVLLFDARPGAATDAITGVESNVARDVARGRLSPGEAEQIAARLTAAGSVEDLAESALVIEAIAEELGAKQELFDRLDDLADAATLFATNTSSLSVSEIASGATRGDRCAGMHFFNPAPRLPLVEIVRTADTSDRTASTLVATARRWGKTPVLCSDTPGFIVNRVARPFYLEALGLLEEGAVEPERLDAVFRGAGFPMGPCELLDLIGLDVNLAVSESVFTALGEEPRIRPSPLQHAMVEAGHLGRKTGRGFYEYPNGAPSVAAQPPGRFSSVEVVGDLGHGSGLGERIGATHGLAARDEHDEAPGIVVDGVKIEPAPGSPDAAAIFDVADWSRATAVGVWGDDAAAAAFAAVGETVGIDTIRTPVPGVVLRTVAMLVAMAEEAVAAGVADADDVDTAMRLGLRHPLGPFEWRSALGEAAIAETLRRLASTRDRARYRPVAS